MSSLSEVLESMFGPPSEPQRPSLFDMHQHLVTFYNKHVRLGRDHRAELAEKRRVCLNLLKDGLHKLGEKPYGKDRRIKKIRDQGSYAMGTLNKHRKNEYDIDVAVIFEAKDLPTTSLKARQLVATALRTSPLVRFATKPQARTNAVTVWYGEGQHVDLAIYREVSDSSGAAHLEHAGPEWRPRDPREINRWFINENKRRSPTVKSGATVPKYQFRRMVQLLKAFARSRVSWQLPGGLILSTLVSEVYQPHPERDDVAFYETLVALQSRLRESTDVRYPVEPRHFLAQKTHKREFAAQVSRLLEKLDFVLPYLEPLKNAACLEPQALMAWYWVFHHSYWRKKARKAEQDALVEPAHLSIRIGLADRKGGPIQSYCRGANVVVPKGTWLRFALSKRLEIEPPFTVRWIIHNRGGEAVSAEDLQQEHAGGETKLWWVAAYEGRHAVTCELIKEGKKVARGVRHIRVTSG